MAQTMTQDTRFSILAKATTILVFKLLQHIQIISTIKALDQQEHALFCVLKTKQTYEK